MAGEPPRDARGNVVQVAGTGDDAVQLDGGLFTGNAGNAAANGADGIAEGPGDEFAGVEGRGFLPGQPLDGVTSNVESENVGVNSV